ncbi:MAG: rhombotarget lipoprotein [Gemmatimonadaceae bacterium]
MSRPSSARRAAALLLVLSTAGCAAGATRHASSVVDYLYPEQDAAGRAHAPAADDPGAVPELRLPLRVGIAFVPTNQEDAYRGRVSLPGTDRAALLESVARHFRQQRFVKAIEIVPTSYLAPRGGFANLDQVGRMFDLDVVALVSFDQVQFTDTRRSAITYLTIVGAYVVNGEKNDTRTILDAAVFDLRSRKLLFRAPGASHVKGSAAPVNLSERRRQDSEEGFRIAARELIANLERELERFKARAKDAPEDYRVVPPPPGA